MSHPNAAREDKNESVTPSTLVPASATLQAQRRALRAAAAAEASYLLSVRAR